MKNRFVLSALSVVLFSCITLSHTHANNTFVHKEGRVPYIIHPKNDVHMPFSLTSILKILSLEDGYTQNALWEKELWITTVLGGTAYKIIGWLGRGVEGIVFRVLSPDDKLFALKVYNSAEYQTGDKIAFEKAVESKPLMNIAVAVNDSYCYSIFPYLGRTLHSLFAEFIAQALVRLKHALKKDGLELYDFHEGNWMIDDNGNLIRIDLGSLMKAEQPKVDTAHNEVKNQGN